MPGRLRPGVRYAAPERQRSDQRIAQLRIIVSALIGGVRTAPLLTVVLPTHLNSCSRTNAPLAA